MGTAVRLRHDKNDSTKEKIVSFGENYEHLKNLDLNDDVNQMVVEKGYYAVVYQDASFGGNRKAYGEGTYDKDSWDFGMSAIKTYAACAAIVYDSDGFSGNSVVIDCDMSNFDKDGFIDDNINSIEIMPGYSLTFYYDSHFNGKSVTYKYEDHKDGIKTIGDDKNKFSSVKVTYNFGVQAYANADFNGNNQQFKEGSYIAENANPLSSFRALKVNLGYAVELFTSSDYSGSSKKYTGPCVIDDTGVSYLSMKVQSGIYAVRAYDGNGYTGSHIDIPVSVYDMQDYKIGDSDWNDRISSIMVSQGFSVQLFKDGEYSGDNTIIVADKGDILIDFTKDFADQTEMAFAKDIKWDDWNKKVSSIRVYDIDFPAVYLFKDASFEGACVKRIDAAKSKYYSWCWNGDDGRVHSLGNDELSSVLITGNLKATLYEDVGYSGDSITLYGPGFFNLEAYDRRGDAADTVKEPAIRNELFHDKASSISISSYVPVRSVPAGVRGYSGLQLLRGDLHSHTAMSDAEEGGKGATTGPCISNPQNIFEIYQALGYDFNGISDHVFGTWGDEKPAYKGKIRYTGTGTGTDHDNLADYSLNNDDWKETKKQANKTKHNFNFASLAGFEYCLGGIAAAETKHTDDPVDSDAHFNVFGTDDIYFGEKGGWANTPETRRDFYGWVASEYKPEEGKDLIVQFNHPSNGGKGFNYFDRAEAAGINIAAFKLQEVFSVSKEGDNKEWVGAYNTSLSKGWKVGATATTDNHDGIDALKKYYKDMRTVVAAEDASKEKILAALRQRRVYASRVPGLGIAFSLTNESSKTVIMGGDMEKQGILRLDFSAALPSSSVDSITDVALYAYKFGVTKETQKLIIYSTTESGAISNTPFVSNYTLTPEWLYEADYMYAIVKSVNCPDYAAVTSPIWFIA